MILLLVDIEWLRDAMPTDGAHCGAHSAIHLLQLSLAERLIRHVLFLDVHKLFYLKVLYNMSVAR